MARIIIVWGLWGPYHCSRYRALRELAAREGHEAIGVSLFSGSSDYQWKTGGLPEGVVHFDLGRDETRFPLQRVGRLTVIPRQLRADVAFLPSYDHWSLALNAAARMSRCRTVMMNDSHAGTARARGLKAAFKRQVVASFHAGFVAGEPHRRYFASLGLPAEKIYTGYDAVDNDYFAARAAEVRNRRQEFLTRYQLPEHYFLSLGRFVAKKNLPVLIQGYSRFLKAHPATQNHLVFVGSGEEEAKLRAMCGELRLPVYDKTKLEIGNRKSEIGNDMPGVHFYGFRQLAENPVFYALADAFILPSLYEEWGLVVNEAMASGLPVIVSETVGCAEDLLPPGQPPVPPGLPEETQARLKQAAGQIRKNGFVFAPESVPSLTNALFIMEAASEIRVTMAKASQSIIDRFSCENFATNALLAADAAMEKRTRI
jgi:glycosyltransferase involved in cell wall biosynthesis